MRSKFAVAPVALALVVAASRVIANPLGVPPTAKPFDVIEGKTISIELGTPTEHGWYVLIWRSAMTPGRASPHIQPLDISASGALPVRSCVWKCAVYIGHGFDMAVGKSGQIS